MVDGNVHELVVTVIGAKIWAALSQWWNCGVYVMGAVVIWFTSSFCVYSEAFQRIICSQTWD